MLANSLVLAKLQLYRRFRVICNVLRFTESCPGSFALIIILLKHMHRKKKERESAIMTVSHLLLKTITYERIGTYAL